MKKDTYLIYYPPGCYGTFLEWLCTSFSNRPEIDSLPFTLNGSSHNYIGNLLMPASVKLNEYLNSNQTVDYARICPSIFEKVNSIENIKNNSLQDIVEQDLEFLQQNFKKIIVLHPSKNNKMWLQNNVLEKCFMTKEEFDKAYAPYGYKVEFMAPSLLIEHDKKLKAIIETELDETNAQRWGKNSIQDLDYWELRELLSLYWYERDENNYDCWSILETTYPNIKFMSIDELKNNTVDSLGKALQFFDILNFDSKKLSEISEQWRKCQYHINKDDELDMIVSHIVNNHNHDWNHVNLTILDEAYIQKQLRFFNIEIRCFNLNKFPTNTGSFRKLIET